MGMPETKDLFLGFDPGGIDNFGWSICIEVNGFLQRQLCTGLADDAWDAITQVRNAIMRLGDSSSLSVRAAGIDAPLLWNKRGDNNGRRRADYVLIAALEQTGFPQPARNTVLALNSLRGADVVQGSLLVRHLSATWDLAITECHPTVIEHLLNHMGQQDMVAGLTEGLVDDERDATLAAISAWAAYRRPGDQWQDLFDQDYGLVNPSQIPVGYWMPIP